jgi:hypothetical protein
MLDSWKIPVIIIVGLLLAQGWALPDVLNDESQRVMLYEKHQKVQ